jgi:hypothetical protein
VEKSLSYMLLSMVPEQVRVCNFLFVHTAHIYAFVFLSCVFLSSQFCKFLLNYEVMFGTVVLKYLEHFS